MSAQSLQVLIKQADLDKGRRNDGLTSEDLSSLAGRWSALCRLPCVASAATSHASVLPDSGVRLPRLGSDGPVDATQCSA